MLQKSDHPIHNESEDALGRVASVKTFCNSVLRLDPSEGLVVGVLGPWGSGKTSFVNMARQAFERESIVVVEFNPWMFSGAEQLVQSFFSELSAQLKIKPGMADIGKSIEQYGEVFANLAWLSGEIGLLIKGSHVLARFVSGILQRKKEGLPGQRPRVSAALQKLTNPIVVVLDDIDRLSTAEIRDIFRLVRLTANFPNLIYLLAFDRHRVEAALSEKDFPGRAYLEKIVQVFFDLPVIPESVLNQQVFDALESALSGIEGSGSVDHESWPDIYMEVIRPLITNMRDIKRYAATVAGTARELNGQIALVDVLGLEAVRVFLPDVFYKLPSAINALTTISDQAYNDSVRDAKAKEQLEDLVALAGDRSAVVRAMIERMFPAGQRYLGNMHYSVERSRQWLCARRVAHVDILRLYLERVAGQGLLAFNIADEVWSVMPNEQALTTSLESIPSSQIVDVISSLEAYEDDVSPDRVLPGIVSLLNLLPSLPETERGMFSIGTKTVVGRVVFRLIRSQDSEDFVKATVEQALPRLKTLQARLMLIQMVGHSEGGHKLISPEVAADFARAWRADLRRATVEQLAAEPELLRSVLVARHGATADEPKLVLPDDPMVTLSILRSARTESILQTMSTRAVKRMPRLAWDFLTEVYGNEDTLRQRIDGIRELRSDAAGDLLELADRYLSGWRPKEFNEE